MDIVFPPETDSARSAIVYSLLSEFGVVVLSQRIVPVNMPPPRPSHIAEREELDAALAKGTAEALVLFLERHPQSRYRPEAEAALQARLRQTSPRN